MVSSVLRCAVGLSRSCAGKHLIQSNRNSSCSSAGNQCSPFFMTVSVPFICLANWEMVEKEVNGSFLPYKMLVGMFQVMGCSLA